MFAHDEMTEQMRDIRDRLFATLEAHEQEEHAGGACWGNRISAIAYLCHSLGISEQQVSRVREVLAVYDAVCRDRHCKHKVSMD